MKNKRAKDGVVKWSVYQCRWTIHAKSHAFISELYYRSNTSITEFIEVTLKATEDPADYTLSFHTQSGALYSGSNAPGQVGGLLLLSDPNNAVSQNTTDPDYNVYTIITRFTTSGSRNGESRAVALSNTETGEVIDAYAVGRSNIALTGGPAAGTTALKTGTSGSNTTIQWDSDRVKTVATPTPDASNVVCFCAGTYVETPSGPCNISDLRADDLVHTLDRGAVAIHWIGVSEWRKDLIACALFWSLQGRLGRTCPNVIFTFHRNIDCSFNRPMQFAALLKRFSHPPNMWLAITALGIRQKTTVSNITTFGWASRRS